MRSRVMRSERLLGAGRCVGLIPAQEVCVEGICSEADPEDSDLRPEVGGSVYRGGGGERQVEAEKKGGTVSCFGEKEAEAFCLVEEVFAGFVARRGGGAEKQSGQEADGKIEEGEEEKGGRVFELYSEEIVGSEVAPSGNGPQEGVAKDQKEGATLLSALKSILRTYHSRLTNIEMVHFDPYGECESNPLQGVAVPCCENESSVFGSITLNVRPLCKGNLNTPQLCVPYTYVDQFQTYRVPRADLRLFSVVA